jgi:hypothetical protein
MLHLVWSGYGYAVPALTFMSCLLMELTTCAIFQDNRYYQDHVWPMPLALALAGLICIPLGSVLNRGEPRTLVDVKTGEEVVEPSNRHTFFFIAVQYWGVLLMLIAGVCAIYRAL